VSGTELRKMPQFTDADTLRILVATDNHVGYEERDPIRKDDSWRTFDEIINLARTEDVGCADLPLRSYICDQC
jgi:hypothetical protein